MLQRILVAVIFVPLILLLLLAAPSIAIPIVISILSMIAVHEVLWSTGFVKNAKLSGYSIVLAGAIPFGSTSARECSPPFAGCSFILH